MQGDQDLCGASSGVPAPTKRKPEAPLRDDQRPAKERRQEEATSLSDEVLGRRLINGRAVESGGGVAPPPVDAKVWAFDDALQRLGTFVKSERTRLKAESEHAKAVTEYADQLYALEESRSYLAHLQKKGQKDIEDLVEGAAARVPSDEQRLGKRRELLARASQVVGQSVLDQTSARRRFFAVARRWIDDSIDGKDGRPKLSLEFRWAVRSALECWRSLNEQRRKRKSLESQLASALANNQDAGPQLDCLRSLHVADLIEDDAEVAKAVDVVTELAQKASDIEQQCKNASQDLEACIFNQRKREQSFFHELAEPLLVGVRLLDPPETGLGSTVKAIRDPQLQQKLQKAVKIIADGQQALQDHRLGHRTNLERWLMARTENTRQVYEPSFHQRMSKVAQDIEDAETRCRTVLQLARAAKVLSLDAQEFAFEEQSEDGNADSEGSGVLHAKRTFAAEVAVSIAQWRQAVSPKGRVWRKAELADPAEALGVEIEAQDNIDSWSQFRATGHDRERLDKHVADMAIVRAENEELRSDRIRRWLDK
ncbi:hypothetical protein LTR36_008919 [Oleoguttula mirabilis]|uniref:Uncharacterized protein n=1 Tax=Oleoguttula mirabilis TaxID=1507867 RepID=A0AAV9J7N5_9PEZI|nr:hypothetical protein LTR36_008919 [Oleoguttula mirabilis]